MGKDKDTEKKKSKDSDKKSADKKSKSKQSSRNQSKKKSSGNKKDCSTKSASKGNTSSSTSSVRRKAQSSETKTKAKKKTEPTSATKKPASAAKEESKNVSVSKDNDKSEMSTSEKSNIQDVASVKVDFSSIVLRVDTNNGGERDEEAPVVKLLSNKTLLEVEIIHPEESKPKSTSSTATTSRPTGDNESEAKQKTEQNGSEVKKKSAERVKLSEVNTAKNQVLAEKVVAPNFSRSGDRNDRRQRKPPNPASELLRPGTGILSRALEVRNTLTGLPINYSKVNQLTTLKDEDRKRAELMKSTNPRVAAMIEIMSGPFNQISIITQTLGLTGAWGIVAERFEEFPCPVRCVINATYEVPLLEVDNIVSYRIPVADNEKENMEIYFDEVTEKMHEFALKNKASVVHCMAGVSRSATIVIAYLMRYSHNMRSLELAFIHTKAARCIVRPNLAFLRQLGEYEKKLHGEKNCSPWRDYTENGITKQLPNFVIERFLDDYQNEFDP